MTSTPVEEARRDALVERLFGAMIGAFDLGGVYIGDRLGLYRVIAERGPVSAAELASAAGIQERYALEWLEQQAASAILDVVDAEDGVQRFELPAGHAEALLDEESLNYVSPFAGCWSPASDRSTRSSTRTRTVAASPMPTMGRSPRGPGGVYAAAFLTTPCSAVVAVGAGDPLAAPG